MPSKDTDSFLPSFLFAVLGVKPRASHLLGKHSTIELHPQTRHRFHLAWLVLYKLSILSLKSLGPEVFQNMAFFRFRKIHLDFTSWTSLIQKSEMLQNPKPFVSCQHSKNLTLWNTSHKLQATVLLLTDCILISHLPYKWWFHRIKATAERKLGRWRICFGW